MEIPPSKNKTTIIFNPIIIFYLTAHHPTEGTEEPREYVSPLTLTQLHGTFTKCVVYCGCLKQPNVDDQKKEGESEQGRKGVCSQFCVLLFLNIIWELFVYEK